jgi:hypothetical protein
MWSFAFSDVAPVADLGIFASASIALGFIVWGNRLVLSFSVASIAGKNIKTNNNPSAILALAKIPTWTLFYTRLLIFP